LYPGPVDVLLAPFPQNRLILICSGAQEESV
jgi:hypothetical protein